MEDFMKYEKIGKGNLDIKTVKQRVELLKKVLLPHQEFRMLHNFYESVACVSRLDSMKKQQYNVYVEYAKFYTREEVMELLREYNEPNDIGYKLVARLEHYDKIGVDMPDWESQQYIDTTMNFCPELLQDQEFMKDYNTYSNMNLQNPKAMPRHALALSCTNKAQRLFDNKYSVVVVNE